VLTCKKHCFLILQGSVLRHTRWSETRWYAEVRYSFLVNLMQKLSKSVSICKSCCKKFTATFLCPTVYSVSWLTYYTDVCADCLLICIPMWLIVCSLLLQLVGSVNIVIFVCNQFLFLSVLRLCDKISWSTRACHKLAE